MSTSSSLVSATRTPKASTTLPELALPFSPIYAWLLIGFSGIMFLIGLLFLSPSSRGRNVGLGIFICPLSIAGVIGANYWRHHLPVMVRMTSRHLFLPGKWPRRVVVDWDNIVAIEKKTLTISRYGTRHGSEFVCIKLRKPLPMTDPLSNASPTYKRLNEALMKGVSKAVMGGYDLVINPVDEFARPADWFLAECQKRMTADS